MKKETYNSFSYDLTTFFGRRHHLQNTTFFALSLRVNGLLNNLISILFILLTFPQDRLENHIFIFPFPRIWQIKKINNGNCWGLMVIYPLIPDPKYPLIPNNPHSGLRKSSLMDNTQDEWVVNS